MPSNMENENRTPELPPEDDYFQREEKCRRALNTVRKAILMRLVVTALLIWIFFQTGMELWIVGLMVFVGIINLTGILPLFAEWKKQRKNLKEILAEEE